MRNYAEKKQELYKYQKGKCYGCGKVFKIYDFTIDHIYHKSRVEKKAGVTKNPVWIDELFNLRLLCLDCHLNKRPRGFGLTALERIEEDLKKEEGVGDWIKDDKLREHYKYFIQKYKKNF
jgi:5-methylcytosine-specific restriction endonuclease McrA